MSHLFKTANKATLFSGSKTFQQLFQIRGNAKSMGKDVGVQETVFFKGSVD